MATMTKDWKAATDLPEKERYGLYLASREWALLKEQVKRRSGGICERCKINPSTAVHHLTYERKYREELEDLQDNCEACHKFTHGKSDVDPAMDGAWIGPLTGIFQTRVRYYFFFAIQRTSAETCECVHQCWAKSTRHTLEMLSARNLEGVPEIDLTKFIGKVYALWTSGDPVEGDCFVERMRPMDGPNLLDSPRWRKSFFLAQSWANHYPAPTKRREID